VSFHGFKMVILFGLRPQDDDEHVSQFIRRAILAASDSLRSLNQMADSLGIVISSTAAVHCGQVQLGLMDVPGSAWEAHGRVVRDCEELATKSVVRLGGAIGSVIAMSDTAMAQFSRPRQRALRKALRAKVHPTRMDPSMSRSQHAAGPG